MRKRRKGLRCGFEGGCQRSGMISRRGIKHGAKEGAFPPPLWREATSAVPCYAEMGRDLKAKQFPPPL
jgi:hypothetical protein